jgi:Tfp pilus assembly protein PilF
MKIAVSADKVLSSVKEKRPVILSPRRISSCANQLCDHFHPRLCAALITPLMKMVRGWRLAVGGSEGTRSNFSRYETSPRGRLRFRMSDLKLSAISACFFAVFCCSAAGQRGSAGYVPQINAGDRALAAHKYASAAYAYRYALEWNPDGVEAHVGLGNVYLKTGKKDRARDQFAEALRIKPHSSEAERGIHDARTPGQEEAAFQVLEKEAQSEPNNADVQTTYAEELIERDRLLEGKERATAALKLNSHMWHAYCALGRIAAKEGDDKTATDDLEIAVSHDDEDDDAIAALGELAMKNKQYVYAALWYRKLVKILPDERDGYQKLIGALDAGNQTAEADRVRADLKQLELLLAAGDN